MSFQSDAASSAGARFSKLKANQLQEDELPFERTIKDNVQQMQDYGRRAEEILQSASRSYLSKIEDMNLSDALRASQKLEQDTERTFREWTVHMAGEPLQRQRKKFLFEKLRRAFDEQVAHLKEANRRAASVRQASSRHLERDEELGSFDAFASDASPTCASSLKEGLIIPADDVGMISELGKEREEGIKRIQGQMSSVNQIFRDLASIVNEQGKQFSTIEDQAEGAACNTKQAVSELQQALKRGSSTGHVWFVIILIVLVVCFVILAHMSSEAPAAASSSIGRSFATGSIGARDGGNFESGFGTKALHNGNPLV